MKRKDSEKWIERRIVTGLIVSDDFIRKVSEVYHDDLLESSAARMLADWCLTYYKRYSKAPQHDIQNIYTAHLRSGLDANQAEDIESILSSMSSEFDRDKFNVDYLLDETMKYFTVRNLKNHIERVKGELDTNNVTEAEKIAVGYSQIKTIEKNTIDPFTREAVSKAFRKQAEPLIRFGKALGRIVDPQCTRDSFIAFLGPEKRGKSFILLEFAMRGLMSNCNVAFFQAGDMSEDQQIKRICTYVAKRSTDERYCGELLIPIVDCEHNQNDTCRSKDRECNFGLQLVKSFDEMSFDEIRSLFENSKGYKVCGSDNCSKRKPAIWFKRRPPVDPLTEFEAQKINHKFRKRYRKQFKLATYPNETLTINEIRALLDTWERTELFVPDILILDYADILASDADTTRLDHRHQENKKWQRLRSLSQERHCLLVTATQSDTDSYDRELLTMKNFSETKTKNAHVSAMFGLNQDELQKKIGIMRINEIVIREGDFDRSTAICVLQRLQIGRPFLASF